MVKKLWLFLQESRQELRRVNWPSRRETARLTLVVIGISLGLAFFLGIFDYLFTLGIMRFFL